MDRTTELKNDYEAMQGLVEKLRQRLALKVEPKESYRWYLFEKEGEKPKVEQYGPEMYVYLKKFMEIKGWTITPVDIFRTS